MVVYYTQPKLWIKSNEPFATVCTTTDIARAEMKSMEIDYQDLCFDMEESQ